MDGRQKPKSETWNTAMKIAHTGNTYCLGLKRGLQSEEHKRKMVETRRKNNSYIAWNKGIGKPFPNCSVCDKKLTNHDAKVCGRHRMPTGIKHFAWKGGKPKCLVCEKQLSQYTVKYCLRHKGITNRGENNINWKGGITPENEKIRKSIEYRLWREAVFARDNFTCCQCGIRGGDLEADHIKPFSLFPELRFAIDNGRTLCVPCHRTTDTYGRKIFTYAVKLSDSACNP